jgi:glutamyl-tRNA synthetase
VTNPTPRPVRTRFAPSPTGSLHIGGLRTALFNWLFARHHNGQFILRIEDTDQKRFDPDALRTLTEALRWAGLEWDEGPEVGGPYGPYVQSERLELYQEWADWLVQQGKAYPSYETAQELEAMRKESQGYNRAHRDLTPDQRAAFEAEGRKAVIRLKMPLEGETVIQDVIHGEVRFENAKQQDIVLLKSDGFPTYHLAHVVDDYFMKISHVMRAVEWLPSLPVHWQLWQAFGWETPIYAHLPVMLNPNGKGKMSKRNPPRDEHGNIIPVMVHDYINRGYLPEAVVNFLANVGWNFGEDREVFSIPEAIERFDLSRINEANAAFPVQKLEWINGVYIREISVERLAELLRKPLEEAGLKVDGDVLRKVAPLVQTRLKTLNDVVELAGFFFQPTFTPAPTDQLIQKKMDQESTLKALEQAHERLAAAEGFNHDTLEPVMRSLADEMGLKPSALFGVLRVATTGQTVSTPLFETMEILGKAITLERVQLSARSLKNGA